MFKSPDWKQTAELAGIFGILVSLFFVALQLHQEQDLLDLELRMGMIETQATINEAIIENIEVWTKGNAGEKLAGSELETFKLLLTNLNDLRFQTSQIFRKIAPESEDQILSMYAGFLVRNPGAYRVWIERERILNADRTAIDPTETITSEWIEAIESRMETIKPGSLIEGQ